MVASIFFDFALPNATTWFFFSFLLALAVFFRFDRPLALRNWDLLTLYMLVPGLLLLLEAHALQGLLPAGHRDVLHTSLKSADELQEYLIPIRDRSRSRLIVGYVWLIAGSGYFFARSLFDLGLESARL